MIFVGFAFEKKDFYFKTFFIVINKLLATLSETVNLMFRKNSNYEVKAGIFITISIQIG